MLCLASACFTLVAVEGALRCMPKTSLLYLDSAPRKLVTADYAHLLRPDPDPRVLISFRPHLDDTFMDKAVRTNAQGFRGPELREGTRRIVGIGDSVMFGWGVDDAETYMRRLERELATDYPDVEVVNTALPSYNTVQEVSLLSEHVDLLRPAWVILGFLGNDFEPPTPVFPRAGLLERYSYLYRLVELRSQGITPAARVEARKREALEALHRLGRLGRERGFNVMVFLYAGIVTRSTDRHVLPHPEVRAVCEEEAFVIVDLQNLLLDAIEAAEIQNSFDIWLRKTKPIDPHPSPLGHALIARGLARALRRELRADRKAAPDRLPR